MNNLTERMAQWHQAVEDVAVAMTQASNGYFVRNLTPDEIIQLARIAVNTTTAR